MLQAHPIINYLFNNAGYLTREEEVTVDGLEREWAINTIAPYVLSEQLRPALAKGGVIVNTSSGAVYAYQTMKNLLDTGYKTPGLLGMYSMSKRVLTTMTLHMKTSFAQEDIYPSPPPPVYI